MTETKQNEPTLEEKPKIMQYQQLKADEWVFYKKEAENELKRLEVLKTEFEDRIRIIDNTKWIDLPYNDNFCNDKYHILYRERRNLYNVINNEFPQTKRSLEILFNRNEKMTIDDIGVLHSYRRNIDNRFCHYMSKVNNSLKL